MVNEMIFEYHPRNTDQQEGCAASCLFLAWARKVLVVVEPRLQGGARRIFGRSAGIDNLGSCISCRLHMLPLMGLICYTLCALVMVDKVT